MLRKMALALGASLLLSVGAAGQMQGDLLDVFVARVKPDKRGDFDAIIKKVADANRKNEGSEWVALDTIYGEGNTVYFVSVRPNYAAIEQANKAFNAALQKAFGEAGAGKIFQDFGNTVEHTRSEVRLRRWDLSANYPQDAAAMAKLVGQARYLRSFVVHVRPGKTLDFEAQVKELNAALVRANPQWPSLVSLVVAGSHGATYYISTLQASLGAFDSAPLLPQILGEDGFRKFLSTSADSVAAVDSIITRIAPDLSNPPDDIASAAPDFWRPKPKEAAKPKPKPEPTKAEGEKKQ